MTTLTFSGGERLEAALRELAEKANKNALLKVGFFEDATENKSGISTAYVAACNEFGGTIPARTVPAHTGSIYRRIDKAGNFLNDAKFVKKGKSNFQSEHMIPEHAIPEHTVPARPFFRRMINLGKSHWGEDLAKFLKQYKCDSELALEKLGLQMVEELQESIQARVYAPLSPSTIAKKGHDQTLVDSGDMLNAATFKIET